MAKKWTVEELDERISPHRLAGDNALVATVKAAREMRRERKAGEKGGKS